MHSKRDSSHIQADCRFVGTVSSSAWSGLSSSAESTDELSSSKTSSSFRLASSPRSIFPAAENRPFLNMQARGKSGRKSSAHRVKLPQSSTCIILSINHHSRALEPTNYPLPLSKSRLVIVADPALPHLSVSPSIHYFFLSLSVRGPACHCGRFRLSFLLFLFRSLFLLLPPCARRSPWEIQRILLPLCQERSTSDLFGLPVQFFSWRLVFYI